VVGEELDAFLGALLVAPAPIQRERRNSERQQDEKAEATREHERFWNSERFAVWSM